MTKLIKFFIIDEDKHTSFGLYTLYAARAKTGGKPRFVTSSLLFLEEVPTLALRGLQSTRYDKL